MDVSVEQGCMYAEGSTTGSLSTGRGQVARPDEGRVSGHGRQAVS
jgi:hypothetical protein